MKEQNIFRKFPNEEFQEIIFNQKHKLNYAISNKGRLVSYKHTMRDAKLLKGGLQDGYRIFRYKIVTDGNASYYHMFFYKMVAEKFLIKQSENQKFILHLDFERSNDDVRNLMNATREEMLAHSAESPHVIAAQKKFIEGRFGTDAASKLDSTKVMHIKKLLANPNRKTRKKMIAKQFGVSVMQIRRIETGENWSQVEI